MEDCQHPHIQSCACCDPAGLILIEYHSIITFLHCACLARIGAQFSALFEMITTYSGSWCNYLPDVSEGKGRLTQHWDDNVHGNITREQKCIKIHFHSPSIFQKNGFYHKLFLIRFCRAWDQPSKSCNSISVLFWWTFQSLREIVASRLMFSADKNIKNFPGISWLFQLHFVC